MDSVQDAGLGHFPNYLFRTSPRPIRQRIRQIRRAVNPAEA